MSTSRRAVAGLVVMAIGLSGLASSPSLQAQTATCTDSSTATPESYGPTDISATSGNESLSVAVNRQGTVTVFRWPSPSFYDQIKYRTIDRTQPRMGALANEGAFFGLAWRGAGKQWRFTWLRDWTSIQRFADDDGDEVVTTFSRPQLGLTVVQRDLVGATEDVMLRRVTVTRSRRSQVKTVRLFSFANFNPVYSKIAQTPTSDWCEEEDSDDGASYDAKADAIVQSRLGVDASTSAPSGVALVMGFANRSSGHMVGSDSYQQPGAGTSAYDDAEDGSLTGTGGATGQSDAALSFDLPLKRKRSGATTLVIAAGRDPEEALQLFQRERRKSYARFVRAKREWWKVWLDSAPLPKGAPSSVVRLSKRALISLRQAIDRDTSDIDNENVIVPTGGLIVASIATQSPFAQDWIRDGAYINHALDIAGHHEIVEEHNLRYAVLQFAAGDQTRGGDPVPPGNWSMNFYADGVVGGNIPFEIDETGYGVWTLWDHYAQTKDRHYLINQGNGVVYEAIQRAAQYLTDVCRDVSTGLQCLANEGDDPNPSVTLRGAMLAWLALDSAASAARVKGTEEAMVNAGRWSDRRDELGAAIETNFFDPECRCYTESYREGGTLLWPVEYLSAGSAKADDQATINWSSVRRAFDGKLGRGGYEAAALLGNAHAWSGAGEKSLLARGLKWIATVPTTSTGILGEAWMRFPKDDSPIVTMVSQPHIQSQILFYLAALETYGERPYSF